MDELEMSKEKYKAEWVKKNPDAEVQFVQAATRMTLEENIAAIIYDYEWDDGDRPHEEDCMKLGREIMAHIKKEDDNEANDD